MTRTAGRWQPAPERVTLDGDGVHVWLVRLDAPPGPGYRPAQLLSPEETARADRCVLPLERARFTAARAAVREVLSRYTGTPPRRLAFGSSERGRPQLVGPAGLDFNLSHSGGTALIAVARGSRVGVDVEEIDPSVDHRAMARRFLDPTEAELIDAQPDAAGRRSFFTGWTRREAYAKALDCAIPRRLEVSDPLVLWDLPSRPEVCATLVTARPVGAPRCWIWDRQAGRTEQATDSRK
ncbi:4'-phosphopantetheinyl transferase family protein [Streptomyces profundus]|uniref:4'-phosphopantetheinyl transferase family protein n=1 Tax=Streptomyces profundus TaxID=2867410 RepID=UPI001D160D2A|nr:4'-phosphopantetheinyl transferase superfamily protein [Streptomyces sp. MA3_2.13]UED83214.1 4'-phosphopantetheinyl transferase superfamily protein [Streptomyces sp. MA3_2.13]